MMLSYHYAIEFAKEQKKIFGGDMNAFLDVAIECIDKQIPKKTVRDSDMDWFECPVCGRILIPYYANEGDHCKCGQAIDWSWMNNEEP